MQSFMGLREICETLGTAEDIVAGFVDAAGDPCSYEDFLAVVPWMGPLAELTYDSRAVVPGTLFACKGAAFKPSYLMQAVQAGAVAYMAERPYAEAPVPGIVVKDIRRTMAYAARGFFGDPSSATAVVAVTGTKGKTTVTFYLDAILKARKTAPSAMLTGVVIDDGFARSISHNTTPEAIELQRHLARAVEAGCDTVVMEASSQGFKYHRTLGTHFAVGLFTNIGEDHISPIEHPTFEDYFASKLRIFDQSDCAVVNLDSDRKDEILEKAAEAPRLLTYSMDGLAGADVYLSECAHDGEGIWRLDIHTPRGLLSCDFKALGRFNVSNALAAVAAAEALGVSHEAMMRGLADVHVPGRMERYDAPDGSLVGIVDYAHNEMSMEALLRCAREEFAGREVTVVFGATGERGTHRREGLGRAAGSLADRIILTEDDPGSVPVASIATEIGTAVMAAGGHYEVIEDRAEAVHAAVAGARRPAVVLLAGKGAEDTILRREGLIACKPDAQLFCEEVGVAFSGYGDLA